MTLLYALLKEIEPYSHFLGMFPSSSGEKLTDLLKYIDETLVDVRAAFALIRVKNEILGRAKNNVRKIRESLMKTKRAFRNGTDLIERSSSVLSRAANYFRNLGNAVQRMNRKGDQLEGLEMGISAVVEDYRTRFILPCQAHAEKLTQSAERLKTMFDTAVGASSESEAVRAANVYATIVQALDEAREAAFSAFDAARSAYSSAEPPSDLSLKAKAAASRMKSEDLSQEAEGLRQNAVDMKYQLQKLRQEWQERSVLVEQYHKNMGIMNRERQRFPRVSLISYSFQAQPPLTQVNFRSANIRKGL